MFHATFVEENSEFQARLVHEQVDEITAEGTRQKGIVVAAGTEQVLAVNNVGAVQVHSVENAGAEQVDAVTAEGNAQKSAITTYCEGQQTAIDLKVSAANNAKDDAVMAKEQAETAQQNAETAAQTATQRAAEAAQHDILTQTGLTVEQQIAARTNINAAPVDGSYELIETITLTEDTASIVRTQEPDGTPYSFIGLKVLAIVSTGTETGSGTAIFRYKNSNILSIGSAGYIATNARYWFIWAKLENGAWNFERTSGNGGQWDTALGANTTSELRLQNQYPLIDELIINATTSGVPFPAGSIFRIYGVRA